MGEVTQNSDVRIQNSELKTQNPELSLLTPYSQLPTNKKEIIIVSGLPRSGTSMMMKMLKSGGLELLTDNNRKPDVNNPMGYYEYEPVKNLVKEHDFLVDAQGKAIKIVAHLLKYLPDEYSYKIIFMKREIDEVLKSQQIMLGKDPRVYNVNIAEAYKKELEYIDVLANKEPNLDLIYIDYSEIIHNTLQQANIINQFLDNKLNINSMVDIVNPELYRNKSK